ncbi:acyl carrier protein [Pseudomonas hormoni]|uniref:Acyl carrier protein n=2 Tax=Pseudomonas hormoni TaxID=3093767 RepID=A0ABX8F4H2_9PSED|nr:acyl carrier protein [Pseudomonas hormoni]
MSDILSAKLETERRVIRIVSSYLSVDSQDVEFGLRLVEDLYVDSIGLVEIVMVLNESFGIELPEPGVRKWRTVGDVCWLVESVVDKVSC